MDSFTNILKNVLSSFYQIFGAALILTFFFTFFYMSVKESGLRDTIKMWVLKFKSESAFRRICAFSFIVIVILYKTILCRSIWCNPLNNVIGPWFLHTKKGALYTGNIENLLLFMPFSFLLFCVMSNKNQNGTLLKVLWKSVYFSFLFSLSIELCQLLLKVGTFQLTDLFYNTLGGVLGGLIYYICYKIRHKNQNHR